MSRAPWVHLAATERRRRRRRRRGAAAGAQELCRPFARRRCAGRGACTGARAKAAPRLCTRCAGRVWMRHAYYPVSTRSQPQAGFCVKSRRSEGSMGSQTGPWLLPLCQSRAQTSHRRLLDDSLPPSSPPHMCRRVVAGARSRRETRTRGSTPASTHTYVSLSMHRQIIDNWLERVSNPASPLGRRAGRSWRPCRPRRLPATAARGPARRPRRRAACDVSGWGPTQSTQHPHPERLNRRLSDLQR